MPIARRAADGFARRSVAAAPALPGETSVCAAAQDKAEKATAGHWWFWHFHCRNHRAAMSTEIAPRHGRSPKSRLHPAQARHSSRTHVHPRLTLQSWSLRATFTPFTPPRPHLNQTIPPRRRAPLRRHPQDPGLPIRRTWLGAQHGRQSCSRAAGSGTRLPLHTLSTLPA